MIVAYYCDSFLYEFSFEKYEYHVEKFDEGDYRIVGFGADEEKIIAEYPTLDSANLALLGMIKGYGDGKRVHYLNTL